MSLLFLLLFRWFSSAVDFSVVVVEVEVEVGDNELVVVGVVGGRSVGRKADCGVVNGCGEVVVEVVVEEEEEEEDNSEVEFKDTTASSAEVSAITTTISGAGAAT